MKFPTALVGAVVLSALLSPVAAYADCGSVPYRAPVQLIGDLTLVSSDTGTKDVRFDPLKVVVYEPGQRAIVLWNGEEEILLLSTEIRTSEAVSILEVIPFPAEPAVQLGDFETFEKMQRLLIKKAMWRVASGGGVDAEIDLDEVAKITFYERMGAHDVAVVRVDKPDYFVEWVMAFLKERKAINPRIDPRFTAIIQDYLDRGYGWFVFDTIQTTKQLQSRQPVQYRFKSDAAYYPLQISTLETGKTTVDLLLVTPKEIESYKELTFAVKRDPGVTLSGEELATVSTEWSDFMGDADHAMQRVYIRGKLSGLKEDFIVR